MPVHMCSRMPVYLIRESRTNVHGCPGDGSSNLKKVKLPIPFHDFSLLPHESSSKNIHKCRAPTPETHFYYVKSSFKVHLQLFWKFRTPHGIIVGGVLILSPSISGQNSKEYV